MTGQNISISNPCCCVSYRDNFDRSVLNPSGWLRWQEKYSDLEPGDFGWPGLIAPYGSPSAWTISGGKAVCSDSGYHLRGWSSGSTAFGNPFNSFTNNECEFDLKFTGSGRVSLGYYLNFDYDDGKIKYYYLNHAGVSNPVYADFYAIPFAFTSGVTYHVLTRNTDNGIGELWIDGAKVKKGRALGNDPIAFIGSGTLEIDNYERRRMKTAGIVCADNCRTIYPCSFPWPDDSAPLTLPPQIQIDINGINSGCPACSDVFATHGDYLGTGTFVLDRVSTPTADPNTVGFGSSLFGSNVPCAQYTLDATFGCYTRLTTRFYLTNSDAGFSMFYEKTTSGGMDTRPFRSEFIFDAITAGRTSRIFIPFFGQYGHTGDVISVPAAAMGTSGNCRYTQLDITPLY
jgi:hypothetical protein